jgi:hypothetical protein
MLPTKFQRRRLKCEKLKDDRRRMPSDGKSSKRAKNIYLIYYLLSNDCLLYKYQHLILLILNQTINRCSSSYNFKNCEKWEIIHLFIINYFLVIS